MPHIHLHFYQFDVKVVFNHKMPACCPGNRCRAPAALYEPGERFEEKSDRWRICKLDTLSEPRANSTHTLVTHFPSPKFLFFTFGRWLFILLYSPSFVISLCQNVSTKILSQQNCDHQSLREQHALCLKQTSKKCWSFSQHLWKQGQPISVTLKSSTFSLVFLGGS